VSTPFKVKVIQYCIRNDASGDDGFFDVYGNAVWQVAQLYVSGGGCLR
jgi:hypothetical protein